MTTNTAPFGVIFLKKKKKNTYAYAQSHKRKWQKEIQDHLHFIYKTIKFLFQVTIYPSRVNPPYQGLRAL